MYKKCYTSCNKCSEGGSNNLHKCIECKPSTSGKLKEDNTYNCISSCNDNKKIYESDCIYCDDKTAVIGDYCINCKLYNQYRLEDDTVCNSLSCSDRQCVQDIPEGYYLEDNSFNYYRKCSLNCKTWQTKDICTSCPEELPILYQNKCYTTCPKDDDGNQLYELPNKKCVQSCPYYLLNDQDNFKCLPCDPDYKYKNENKCYHENELPEGHFKLQTEYLSFDMCNDRCSECSEISLSQTDQKCTKCIQGYYLADSSLPNNCVDDCGNFLIYAILFQGLTCINCKKDYSTPRYKHKDNSNKCFQSLPINSLIIDIDTNTFEYCFQNCETCSSISTDINDQRCITCNSVTYKEYNTQNCISHCQFYVQDDSSRTCINCRKELGQYKLIDENKCVNSNFGSYLVDDDTGTIGHCHPNCETCNKGPENNDLTHNCITCKDGYYLQENGSNCEKDCPNYLASKNKKCINCYPHYKFLKENFCRENIPISSYVVDSKYNILSNCFYSCKTCSEEGTITLHKCDSCLTDYYSLEDYLNNCEKDPLYYYLYINTYIYRKCYSSCSSCSKGGTSEKHNCDKCIDGTFGELDNSDNTYNCFPICKENKKYFNKECQYCPKEVAVQGYICLNCKTENKFKLEDNKKCNSLSCENSLCVESVPIGYYLKNSDYNYYMKCDSSCLTCENTSDNCLACPNNNPMYYNHKCYPKCDEPLYFYKGDCIKCPYNVAVDTISNECIDCNTGILLDITLRQCINSIPE